MQPPPPVAVAATAAQRRRLTPPRRPPRRPPAQALTDEESKANLEKYGHPDGFQGAPTHPPEPLLPECWGGR